ncbi:hypothetical protein ACFWZK_33305, partial [[Kitasatospora] papulosa]
ARAFAPVRPMEGSAPTRWALGGPPHAPAGRPPRPRRAGARRRGAAPRAARPRPPPPPQPVSAALSRMALSGGD